MENIQGNKINPRSLSSILTICMLICLFVGFVFGTLNSSGLITQDYSDITTPTVTLSWVGCAPLLVFMIIGLILAVVKFFVCTLTLKKEFPSKDTIKAQFWMELINLIIILLGCISPAFIKTGPLTGINIDLLSYVIGPMILSTLAFAVGVATAGLAYHNYK